VSTFKVSGIALRGLDIREADRIVTFITIDGKLEGIAKGIRRPKSKFGGRLEPGNDLDLVLVRGRGLPTITGIEVKRLRPWIRQDLASLEVTFNIMEMADKFSAEELEDGRLLKITAAALDRLEDEDRPALLRLAYDIKVLAVSGLMPQLSECVVCAAPASERFSVADGGLVCTSCGADGRMLQVGPEVIALLVEALGKRFSELSEVEAGEREIAAADELIWAHIAYHVPARFRSRGIGGEKGISI